MAIVWFAGNVAPQISRFQSTDSTQFTKVSLHPSPVPKGNPPSRRHSVCSSASTGAGVALEEQVCALILWLCLSAPHTDHTVLRCSVLWGCCAVGMLQSTNKLLESNRGLRNFFLKVPRDVDGTVSKEVLQQHLQGTLTPQAASTLLATIQTRACSSKGLASG